LILTTPNSFFRGYVLGRFLAIQLLSFSIKASVIRVLSAPSLNAEKPNREANEEIMVSPFATKMAAF